MKFARSYWHSKIVAAGITATIFAGVLSGCGKSEAAKAAEQAAAQQAAERHDARQKFKEAVAALKVRTDGATYNEFRQAEMDLKTSFEVNKSYLEDMTNQFANLDAFMAATDYLWDSSIRYPMPLVLGSKNDSQAIKVIAPDTDITNKKNYSIDQQENDPDFWAKNYLPKGLAKISAQTDIILNLLGKQN